MKSLIIFCTLWLFSGMVSARNLTAPMAATTLTGSISVTSSQQTGNPRTRTFTYHLPAATPACNLPLMIVLHGDGGSGAGIMNYTGFNAVGDAQNFISVYPDALPVAGSVQWNKFADNATGSGDNGNDANAPDDVQFIVDLIDYFYRRFGVDRSRVYVAGHSGGGFMAYYLTIANASKGRIAGIAPVAASLWGNDTYLNSQFAAGTFSRTPVLHIHATTDTEVGFPDLNSGWIWPEASYAWPTCANAAPVISTNTADITRYDFCTSPVPVVLLALKRAGLGHAWPTVANSGYNTEQQIWSYLSPFSKGSYSVPVPVISPSSASVTAGQTISLTAACPAGLGYTWNTGTTAATLAVSPVTTTTYTAYCTAGLCQGAAGQVVVTVGSSTTTAAAVIDDHIKTDQFGYLPAAQKVAVISSPDPAVSQYNQTSQYTPGSTYQLRRVADNSVVFSGTLVAWNGGATHNQSGDRVWWFDFSPVTTAGTYYVCDVGQNKRSYPFVIADNVYDVPARQALVALKMQRCGVARFGQLGSKIWQDAACHLGNLQDTHCRDVSDPSNVAKERNMSGGWHDAGDFNKYALYAAEALHNLLKAYEENPASWTAVAGTLPAPLDEAAYELDWLLKMQDSDGRVRCKVSIKGYGISSPPGTDTRQRFYGGTSTLTTYAVASVFAHAASVFGSFSATYANTLRTAAQQAWNWANANPNVIFDNTPFLINGGGSFNPDNGIYGDAANSSYYRSVSYPTVAAAYLFRLFGATAGAAYKTAFETLYAQTSQMQWSAGSDAYFPDWQVVLDALLTYANAPDATPAHATAIRTKFTALITTSSKLLPAFVNRTDAYRAYLNYHPWNSNQQKAQAAVQLQLLKINNLSPANNTVLQQAALGYLHYLHGLNPNAKCYLSQMNALGASNSQNEIYHGWFWDGTAYDNALTSATGPFPGFLIGGPNQDYSGALIPPKGQPAQKAYKDWNTDYPDNAYEITEIGIYTQAAYIRLAAAFMTKPLCTDVAVSQSVQSGDWQAVSTWLCGTVPAVSSRVRLMAGHVVTISAPVQVRQIQVDTAGQLRFSTGGKLILAP